MIMTIVLVPVTNFSKKILSATRSFEPIASRNFNTYSSIGLKSDSIDEAIPVHGSDGLLQYLCCRKPMRPNKMHRLQSELNARIAFSLSDDRATEISKNVWQIGQCLQEVHRERFFEYISAKMEEKMSLKQAIEKFCARYDIDIDVDINMDAMIKSYQRHLQETDKAFVQKKELISKVEKKEKAAPVIDVYCPLSDLELDNIIEGYKTNNASFFITSKGLPRKKLLKQIMLYVYHYQGNRSVKELSNKYRLPEQTIYTCIRSFSMALRTMPPLE
jgi:Mor family transcriptional regulator